MGLNLFVNVRHHGNAVDAGCEGGASFLAVLFLFLVIVTYVPLLSTFLPTILMGPEIITV